MDTEKRLTDLEIKMSYLEDFVNQLQEVTVAQAKEIEVLQKEKKILSQKIQDLIEFSDIDIPNRKPPHY